jgi:hypothetical protein
LKALPDLCGNNQGPPGIMATQQLQQFALHHYKTVTELKSGGAACVHKRHSSTENNQYGLWPIFIENYTY